MRSNDVALDAMESKSECVVLDPSDFVCYSLRCLHFSLSDLLPSSSLLLLQRVILQELLGQAMKVVKPQTVAFGVISEERLQT